MAKISKVLSWIKSGTLIFELKSHVGTLGIKDPRAKALERTRRVYKKLEKMAEKAGEYEILPVLRKEKIAGGNTVWVYWGTGLEGAPEIVKACIKSFKSSFPSKNIVVLTDKELPNYVSFPKCITDKVEDGTITKTHFSDILRAELLYRYGGLWVDATVLCTAEEKDIDRVYFSEPLFVFKEMCLDRGAFQYCRMSSWFIFAKANDPIIAKTRNCLYYYWEHCDYLIDYFVFHLFFSISSRHYEEEWSKIPMMNNSSPHSMMFELGNRYSAEDWRRLINECPFHKLERHTDYSQKPDTIYKKILEKYL